MFTNTTQVSAYRGAGRPEGNYYMERLIDTAAREMGIDRLELRRRNHIKPKEMPYKAPSGMTYDSGDFPAVLKRAVELADFKGFGKRKRESEKRGKLRGLGVGSYLEVTAPPDKEMGGIRFEADGDVTIITGTLDYGQGHAAPFAQVLSEKLGVPFERIRLLQGDSDELLAGGGTGGSRSMYASGTAIVEGADKVIEQGKQIAALRARGLGRRHRVRQRAASPSPAPTARSASWSSPTSCAAAEAAGGRAEIARRQARQRRADAVGVPERLPRRRGRDRSRHRRRSRW